MMPMKANALDRLNGTWGENWILPLPLSSCMVRFSNETSQGEHLTVDVENSSLKDDDITLLDAGFTNLGSVSVKWTTESDEMVQAEEMNCTVVLTEIPTAPEVRQLFTWLLFLMCVFRKRPRAL